MKKDAFFFPHDSNAKDDPKCTLLIEELGLEGYGIFWVLLETLRDQVEFKYPLNLLPVLARKYNTTTAKIEVVVKNYGLFEVEDSNFFYSKTFSTRMLKINETRMALAEAGRRGAEMKKLARLKPPLQPPLSIKEKKRKEKESIVLVAKTLIERIEEFKQANPNKYNQEMYSNFTGYWTEKNKNGKERWESEEFFEVGKRLATWKSKQDSFQNKFSTAPRQKGLVI